MSGFCSRVGGRLRRVIEIAALFVVARVVAGVAIIALAGETALAWSWEATAVVVGAVAVPTTVALIWRGSSGRQRG